MTRPPPTAQIPESLLERIKVFNLQGGAQCECGEKGIPIRVSAKGVVHSRCPGCGWTTFWSDPVRKFRDPSPFCRCRGRVAVGALHHQAWPDR